eukprot:2337524-Rhodomonas_salina.2
MVRSSNLSATASVTHSTAQRQADPTNDPAQKLTAAPNSSLQRQSQQCVPLTPSGDTLIRPSLSGYAINYHRVTSCAPRTRTRTRNPHPQTRPSCEKRLTRWLHQGRRAGYDRDSSPAGHE